MTLLVFPTCTRLQSPLRLFQTQVQGLSDGSAPSFIPDPDLDEAEALSPAAGASFGSSRAESWVLSGRTGGALGVPSGSGGGCPAGPGHAKNTAPAQSPARFRSNISGARRGGEGGGGGGGGRLLHLLMGIQASLMTP